MSFLRVALSAGHHPEAKGASHNLQNEHDNATRWVAKIAATLRDEAEVLIVSPGTLPEKVEEIAFLHDYEEHITLAVEIHFNACGGCGAEGAETLHYPGSKNGARAAQAVQAAMVATGARDRGVKEGWYRMDAPGRIDYDGDVEGDEKIDYFLRETPCPAIIVEPEFIEHLPMQAERERALCNAIATGIQDFLYG